MSRRTETKRSPRARGFSLVELLVAALLMLVVIVAIIPMFMQAMMGNKQSREVTQATNFGRSELERFYELDFDSPMMDVPAGETESVFLDHFSSKHKEWRPTHAPEAGDSARWFRTLTVRQFHISAIEGGVFDPHSTVGLLTGSADRANVHLKQVEILVETGDGQRSVRLQTLRAL